MRTSLSYIGKSQRFSEGTLTLPSPTLKKRVGEDTVWLAMVLFSTEKPFGVPVSSGPICA